VAQTPSKPPRHVRREQSCRDSTTMDSSILDSSLLGGRTARDSMVSEGPLATDASFARQAFDCDMSEDMLGARSVSLMVSTPSVTHKKNWLQKQLSSAKKAILRGRSKRSSAISSAEGAGELPTTPSVKLWAAASSTLDESTLYDNDDTAEDRLCIPEAPVSVEAKSVSPAKHVVHDSKPVVSKVRCIGL
jgi:hypothetical protein